MAGPRGKSLLALLLVLAWTLFLGQVQGWDWIDESQLHSLYETGHWSDTLDVRAPHITPASPMVATGDLYAPVSLPSDDRSDYEEGESGIFENVNMVVDGHATSSRGFDDPTESQYKVSSDGSPRSWTSRVIGQSSAALDVVCSNSGFEITLLTGLLSDVKVLGSKDLVPVENTPGSCGYNVDLHTNTLTVPFTGCYVKEQENGYSLQLLHVDSLGHTQVSTAACERSTNPVFDPRAKPERCKDPTTAPPTTTKYVPTTTMITTRAPTTASKEKVCAIPAGERLSCGGAGISSSDCRKMGCCVDSSTSACYYALDECTADQHFIFAIRYNSAPVNVDPTKLIMPKSPNCKPVIVNDKVAIFKFKVTECGTFSYDVGEMRVYLAEVQTIIQALNLKYGVITRSDPIRFMVECRYSKSANSAQASLASVGYMVKTPASTLPSSVISSGVYGIELRMATDKTYTHYYPTNFQPLKVLLGTPVYLELTLQSPTADAVVLVNYCLAYPRSATKALVLVYEGCANPNDPHVSILDPVDPPEKNPKKLKRKHFKVSAFQFMIQKTNKYLDEEIYFMCSAEVCRPAEKKCEQRCFS